MSKTASLPRCPANPESLPFGPDKPWLAPLAGYSDLPFRLLCREYGAAVCVTEMVSAMVMMISARVAPNGIFLFIGEFLSCGSCPRRQGDGAADLIAATSS